MLARDPATLPRVQAVCTQGLNLFRVLMTYLAPVLPRVAAQAAAFLQAGPISWAGRATPLLGSRIAAYEPLLVRVDPGAVSRMVEAFNGNARTHVTGPEGPCARRRAGRALPSVVPEIELADFQKVTVR